MPVFSTTLGTQNQAGSAGVIGYPAIGSIKQFVIFSDEFNRETLNPTNIGVLYTQANNQGTGTTTMTGSQANITTTGTTNDDTTLRTSGLVITRTSDLDSRTQIIMNCTFSIASAANEQFFIGIVRQITQLTGLPTTTRHLGCYLDTSVSNNIILSSSNGTTQSTTDSGLAISVTPVYKLQIIWNGDDSAVITLYQAATGSTSGNLIFTSVSSQTVTSISNGSTFFLGNELNFYIKTLTSSAKTLTIREFNVQAI